MLPFYSTNRKRAAEAEERFLTGPVIILLLLMLTFVCAGLYIMISTFTR